MKKILDKAISYFLQDSLNDKGSFFLLIILVFIVSAPFLFFGKIFLSGDTIQFSYPAAEFFQSHYLSGLNPNLYLGFPLASSFHYAYFNPVYLFIFHFFNYLFGYNLILSLDIFLGAIFFYLLARNLSLNAKEAILATLTYLFSQFSVFWLASITVSNGLFLLPALCWIVCKITLGKSRYVVFLPFMLGYAFLSVHYQFVVMAFVGATVFLIYRLWEGYIKNVSLISNLKPVLLYFAGLFGGMLLGAPQILNTLSSFKYITRSDFIAYDYLKVFDLGRYVLPYFNVFKLTSQEFLPYIGLVSLLLVILVIFFRVRKDKKILFFGVAFLLFFSLMVKYSPTAFILRQLPVFKYFAQPIRWLYVGNLFLALLSGYGFQFLTNNTDPEFFRSILKYLKIVLIVLCSVLLVINALNYFFGKYLITVAQSYFDSHLYASTSHLPLDYYHNLINVLANGVVYNFSFANLNVVLSLILLFAVYFIIIRFRNKQCVANALILLVTFNLLCSFFINTKFADKSLILDKPETTSFILSRDSNPNTFRVFSYMISDAQYQQIAALHPDESLEIEKYSIEGLVGNNNKLALVCGLEPNGDKKIYQIIYLNLNAKDDVFANKIPLLSALNAKYIVTPYILNTDGLELATSTAVTKFNVPLYIYENKKVLPRIYLAKQVVYLAEGDDINNLNTILNPANNFAESTYVECDTCKTLEAKTDTTDKISIVHYGDEHITVNVQSKNGQWLVVGNAKVIGWTAFLDNIKTKIYPANYILQAIYVSKGQHIVDLYYKTTWFPSL